MVKVTSVCSQRSTSKIPRHLWRTSKECSTAPEDCDNISPKTSDGNGPAEKVEGAAECSMSTTLYGNP